MTKISIFYKHYHVCIQHTFGENLNSINDFLVLNIGWRVTKDRSISFEIGAKHQRGRCQNFSSGHNFMDKSVDFSQVSKKKPFQIIHYFFHVTNNRAISSEIGTQHQPDQCQIFRQFFFAQIAVSATKVLFFMYDWSVLGTSG